MLQIYDYLVDVIQEHLKKRKVDADVKSHIERAWHCYRFIQVCPKGITDYVHYEYINGHWELHFENTSDDEEVEILRRKVMSQIYSNGHLDWHRSDGYQKEYLSVNEEIDNIESFLSVFDCLWDATSEILLNNVEEIESTVFEEDALTEDDVILDAYEFMESVINNASYQDPTVRLSSVEDLPFERFVIPPYQRPYKWGVKNVNQLITDVIAFCDKGTNEYRLGTLVLHEQANKFNIVDGQQRTITLILLLNELRNEKEFVEILKNIPISSFLKRPQFHELTSRKHIQENINAIRSRLTEFKEKHVRFLIKSCKFVIVTLYDISEAFQFFDSQNARGKELEPHDLLKAFHLREIPRMTDADKNNITEWENLDTPRLANLFLLLFRIKRWIEGNDGREFTSNNVDTFKGPKTGKALLPYQRIYAMAECYTELYNADLSRRIDGQHMDYPHQIDQVTINGTLFFDMIRYYSRKETVVKEMIQKHCPDIDNAINHYAERYRKGDLYTRNLFTAASMFYYDKFLEDGFEKAVPKIFAWAYGMRIKHYSVQLATMDNLARDYNSFFRMLHRAVSPLDIQNWVIEPIKKSEIQQQGKMAEVFDIFKKYKYIEL
jgi:hypothetical protein